MASIQQGSDDVAKETSRHGNSSLSSVVLFEAEKTRQMLLAIFSKYRAKITMDTMRSLPVFFGITGPSFCLAPDAFNPPSSHFDKNTAEKFKRRIDLNFSFFITNYAAITAGTSFIVILLHPKMVIYCGILYILWKIHSTIAKDSIPLVFMNQNIGKYLTIEIRTRALYLMTIWVVVMYCLQPFLTALTLASLMVLVHAIMRDPKQVDNAVVSVGGKMRSYRENDSDDGNDSSGSEVMV